MAEIDEINQALVALQEQLLALGTVTDMLQRNRDAAADVISAARGVVDTTTTWAAAFQSLTSRTEAGIAALESMDLRDSLGSMRTALGDVSGALGVVLGKMDTLASSVGASVQREASGLVASHIELRDDVRGGLLAMQSAAQEMQAAAANVEGRLLERIQVLTETHAREFGALAARMGEGVERLERQGKSQGILLIIAVILAAASAALHFFVR